MIKTHKIKIYPNATMRRVIESHFDYRRYCWNQALATWNDMYDASLLLEDKKSQPNNRKVRDELVRNKEDWQYCYSARLLQLTVDDLSKAWKNYFNPKLPNHDRPKFKSKKAARKTFKTDRAKIVSGKLRLDKPHEHQGAWFDIRLAEKPRFEGKLKMATVAMEADGYYVSLNFEVAEEVFEPKPVQTFTAVDANIGKFDYKAFDGYQKQETLPQSLVNLYQRITHYQRLLARKRIANPNSFNSNSYRSTKAKLKRDYQKVQRIQEDILHKFTHKLVQDFDVITIEDLNVTDMKMNKRLAKNLHRSMFGKLKRIMTYKGKWNSNTVILADTWYPSTQRCSCCGFVKTGDDKITLEGNKKRGTKHNEYICYECGVEMNRDENAVENLIVYGQMTVLGHG
jgi:putative transposase